MADKAAGATPGKDGELFEKVCSTDFLGFDFGGKAYSKLIEEQKAKSGKCCAVSVKVVDLTGVNGEAIPCVWMEHDFTFFGGSLGSAEGQKLTQGFHYATEHGMPVVVKCATGGARMQEGTLSLMQMAKVSCAVTAHRQKHLPFVTLLTDPTFGGVSASYAMQADVRVGASRGRLGFSGPAVILNTQFGMDQGAYDQNCPQKFQSMEFAFERGQVDIVVDNTPEALKKAAADIVSVLMPKKIDLPAKPQTTPPDPNAKPDYLKARDQNRFDADNIIKEIFDGYIELGGDGKVGLDKCLRCGVAWIGGFRCMVVKCARGHTPAEQKAHNYGMPSPAGYRTALRFFGMAEDFNLPVVSLVDCPGAWPSFVAEEAGQSEAIATNLIKMAEMKVPMVTLVVGEGGSGGALAIAMGDVIGIMERAYYGVITPEGASSILGRYDDEEHKKRQFKDDCYKIATMQQIYGSQLKELGVVDTIVGEKEGETFSSFPETAKNIKGFVIESMEGLLKLETSELIQKRWAKFEAMGKYTVLEQAPETKAFTPAKREKVVVTPPKLVSYIAHQTIRGEHSAYKGKCKASISCKNVRVTGSMVPERPTYENAKTVLDRDGPEALAKWVRAKNEVLLTDTTMRDAHQSLLATRVRTVDMLNVADETSKALHRCFSLEDWGGATFDVAFRFLHEDPFKRLRLLREKIPNICFQMLLRGANAVGYTSYPDNVVEEFVKHAAEGGMDIFRIFDCFNDVEQMRVAINAVRKHNKVASVALCFTGDFLNPDEKIYTLDYYTDLAKKCVDAGAHMLSIKDMAGLLKPLHAEPLIKALRGVTDLPIHFHTHNTSSGQLATLHAMTNAGCDIVDACMASMADTTSQPSLNAFCATMETHARSPGIDYRTLEPLDNYWMRVREFYSIYESGMLAGSANVFHHQIPGGQYSNLYAQCKSLGIMSRWEECLEMYYQVNMFCGDVVKVTPSSKVIGDIALMLVQTNVQPEDLKNMEKLKRIAWPASAVDMAEGGLGTPHHGFPKIMLDAILQGKARLPGRPGASMKPTDFAAVREQLAKDLGIDPRDFTEQDIISAVLYPAVWRDYKKHEQKYDAVDWMPTPAFIYGMEIGEEIDCTPPGGEPMKIKLERVAALEHDDMRTLHFLVNGQKTSITIEDPQGKKAYTGPMAKAGDEKQVASVLEGVVAKVSVKKGDKVKEGDTLCVLSAMKMEVSMKSPGEYEVAEVIVTKDMEVIEGALLVKLK